VVIHTTFRELRNGRWSLNLASKCSSVSRRWIREDIFENFHFRGHLPTKSEIESLSNRHLTQSRLQVTGCTAERYCLLRVVVQGPGSFRYLVNFSIRHTVAELRGIKLPNFRILTYFFPYKTLETYLPVTSQNDYHFPCGRWRSPKKCIPAASFPVTSVRGAGNPQPCPNFRLWQMAIPIQNTKLAGDGPGKHPEKCGTPYLFLQPIKKLVHNRFTLTNTSFRTKLGRVWIRRVPLHFPLWWWCNCVFYVPSKTDGYPY